MTDNLRDLLREVKEKGLIYWEPNTARGHERKAEMISRIDRALAAAPRSCATCDGRGTVEVCDNLDLLRAWRDEPCPACAAAPQPALADREALVELLDPHLSGSDAGTCADALLARGLRLPGGEETMAWAAKIILSQPKRPDSPVAEAFTVACAHLEDRECGAETTNEIIETFLKTLAGEDN